MTTSSTKIMSTSATGYLYEVVPHGERLDEILGLVRVGQLFKKSQCGRRPDALTKYITGLVKELPKPTFENLLDRLDLEAAKRDKDGDACSPVEKVDRVWQLITMHHHRRGRIQITFATLRNKLTLAKNKEIPSKA